MRLELISRAATAPVGPPVLFVHGAFSDARVWDVHLLPFVAEAGHDAHAVSLRGHGGSRGHGGLAGWRLGDYVEDVRWAVSRMPEPPVLVGYSMGGFVAQALLADPPPLAGLVLMASLPPGGLLQNTMHMAMRHPVLLARLGGMSMMAPATGTVPLMRRLLFSPDMPDDLVLRYATAGQTESHAVYADLMMPPPPAPSPVPTLVLGAEDDVFVSPILVRATARHHDAECRIIPRMGHAMMLDVRWRDAADALGSWLARRCAGVALPA